MAPPRVDGRAMRMRTVDVDRLRRRAGGAKGAVNATGTAAGGGKVNGAGKCTGTVRAATVTVRLRQRTGAAYTRQPRWRSLQACWTRRCIGRRQAPHNEACEPPVQSSRR